MSITVERRTKSTVRTEYWASLWAKREIRPRLSIGAPSVSAAPFRSVRRVTSGAFTLAGFSGPMPKPSGSVELGRSEFFPLAQHRIIRCVVQGSRDLGTEPPEDAIGGGVDLFIVWRQADFAVLGHHLLQFYLTIGLGLRQNKTCGGIREPLHFCCGTFLTFGEQRWCFLNGGVVRRVQRNATSSWFRPRSRIILGSPRLHAGARVRCGPATAAPVLSSKQVRFAD